MAAIFLSENTISQHAPGPLALTLCSLFHAFPESLGGVGLCHCVPFGARHGREWSGSLGEVLSDQEAPRGAQLLRLLSVGQKL